MATIVFDFDGTIADTLPIVIDMFNEFSEREPLTQEQIAELREMTIKQIIKELEIPVWRVPSILVQGRRELAKHVDKLVIFDGLTPVIKQLHKDGHTMFLVSSNSAHVIRSFLRRYELLSCFKAVRGNAGLFGKGKVIKSLLKKVAADKNHTYSIGDEVRDIEMARKLGYKSIAVDWGFNGPRVLQANNPDYFVSNPNELLEVIE